MEMYALKNQENHFFKDVRATEYGFEIESESMPTRYFTLNNARDVIVLLKEVSNDKWRVVEVTVKTVEE